MQFDSNKSTRVGLCASIKHIAEKANAIHYMPRLSLKALGTFEIIQVKRVQRFRNKYLN